MSRESFDAMCDLILDEARRNPEKLRRFQDAAHRSGVTVDEAAQALSRAFTGRAGPQS